MAIQINPTAPTLPAATAIQDPAARQFANAVSDALRAMQSPEASAKALVDALNAAAGTGVAVVGNAGGAGYYESLAPSIISEILRSELYSALGRAIEKVTFSRRLIERLDELETGFTSQSEAVQSLHASSTEQINAAVSRLGGAEAAIVVEAKTRATEIEATTEQISTAVSRIAQSEAAIVEEQTTRATSEEAIVEALNTMWSMTGATEALIQSGGVVQTNWNATQANWWNTLQAEVFSAGGTTIRQALAQEATLRSNADGTLYAQYTVKIDQDGYISGFGLASTSNNATPFSEFYVRADRFAVGHPGVEKTIPFIVQDGQVLIDTAVIGTARITNAMIKRAGIDKLSVGTLDIQGDAVTVPRAATGIYVAQVVMTTDVPIRAVMIGTFTQGTGRNGQPVNLLANGELLVQERPAAGTTGAMATIKDLSVGTHVLTITAESYVGDMRCGITVLGVKR